MTLLKISQDMRIFNLHEFRYLTDFRSDHSISIYIPTRQNGHPDETHQAKTRLKNQLKLALEKLIARNLTKEEAEKHLGPIYELLEDEIAWGQLSEGMALFLSDTQLSYYKLPLRFEEKVEVADHLYLLPLIPLFQEDGRFFIMNLSLNQVSLYEATHYSIREVDLEDTVPQGLKEALGKDLEEGHLQFHSGGSSATDVIFHGQGIGSASEKKREILKYFREIDKTLKDILLDERAPLMLAAVDYLVPLYQEANSYPFLFTKHIPGNHEHTSTEQLHKFAWDQIQGHFEKFRKESAIRYRGLADRPKGSHEIDEIIAAAMVGRVDTLFIKKDQKWPGTYNAQAHKVRLEEGQPCLLNQAAVQTILNGGKVFLMDAENMPESTGDMQAILRF